MNQTTEAKDKTDRREIKFRVWHKQQKSILGNDWLLSANVTYEAIFKNLTVEVMQYTGLKDKNGKEIYEGDIVRLIEPNRLYTVEWLECTFKLVHADPKLDRMHWGSINRVPEMNWGIEVVGNIYENPELLNHDERI